MQLTLKLKNQQGGLLTVSKMLVKWCQYYGIIAVSTALTLYLFGVFFRSHSTSLEPDTFDHLLYWSKFFWFTGALVVVTNIIGLLIYGVPNGTNQRNIRHLKEKGWNKQRQLVVVYVSRGENFQALERSIIATADVLEKYGARYRIDVATDVSVEDKHTHGKEVVYHVVPEDYETPNNTRYKARALHYVVERHGAEELHALGDTWVLHLDEESQLDETALAGIHRFINNPANTEAIGQGEIKYNAHNYGKHWFITAMDAIRSGDDLGRFRLQYTIFKKPLFGMHGSFILLPGALEQRYGFDLGGKGSITEDAYFALNCASDGFKFKWVDGYVREQSPYSIEAIVKQRRRWYCGLVYLALDSKIRFATRFVLLVNMALWTVAWFGPLVTIINLVHGGYFPLPLLMLAALLQGFYASVYLIGLWHNMQDVRMSAMRKTMLYVVTFVLVPFTNAAEGFAVLYGIVRPVKHFDVVGKN